MPQHVNFVEVSHRGPRPICLIECDFFPVRWAPGPGRGNSYKMYKGFVPVRWAPGPGLGGGSRYQSVLEEVLVQVVGVSFIIGVVGHIPGAGRARNIADFYGVSIPFWQDLEASVRDVSEGTAFRRGTNWARWRSRLHKRTCRAGGGV